MDKQTDNILHEAAGPCNAELDGLIGETLRRRADKVPTLSDDFEERVMARIKPLSAMPARMEGQASRRRSWKLWAWVSGVAAVCIAIYIMVGGRAPTTIAPQGHDMPTGTPSLLAENPKDPKCSKALKVSKAPKVSNETKVLNAPKVPNAPLHKPVASTPSPRGGNGVGVASSSPSPRGGQGKGPRTGSSPSATPAPTLADLYAAIDLMTSEAIEEADRMMAEALAREYTEDVPS